MSDVSNRIGIEISYVDKDNSVEKLSQVASALEKVAEVSERLQKIASKALDKVSESTKKTKEQTDKLKDSSSDTISSFNRIKSAVTNAGDAFGYLRKMTSLAIAGLIGIVTYVMNKFIHSSSNYIEAINLFGQSMKEYSKDAYDFATTVSELMGIDISNWIENQGIFMTLATGFGVASDRAAIMSKNLTQLGYDISSFFNISVEDSMAKLQSGLAGELEPLRRIGYDLSKARLQVIALELGIRKTFNEMTQAEKAQLRYHAIMTQVVTVQGDMARTLNAPANQLRVLREQFHMLTRSIGNIFIPMLNAVLPYIIAIVKGLRMVADAVASMVGYKLPALEWDGSFNDMASGAAQLEDNLNGAGRRAKELKKQLAGFDEINNLTTNDSSPGGSGIDIGSDGWIDFPLVQYDFLKGLVTNRIDEAYNKLKPFFEFVKNNIITIVGLTGSIWAGSKLLKFVGTGTKLFRELKKEIVENLSDIGWDKYLKNLPKSLLGVGSLTVGIGLSFGSSFDIGQNNINLKNSITEILGLAASAIGGSLLFSAPYGWIIGLGIGLAVSIIGYASGQNKAISDMVKDTFYADNGGVPIGMLVDEFSSFMSVLTNGTEAITSTSQHMNELKTSIENTVVEINTIETAWNRGLISTEEATSQLKIKFQSLYDTSYEYMNGVYDNIKKGVALGFFDSLAEAGISVNAITELLNELRGTSNEAMEIVKQDFSELDNQLKQGLITPEQYLSRYSELSSKMFEVSGVASELRMNVGALSAQMSMVDWGDEQEAGRAMEKLKTSALDAQNQVNLTFDALQNDLAKLRDMAIAQGADENKINLIDNMIQINEQTRLAKLNEIEIQFKTLFGEIQTSLVQGAEEVQKAASEKWNNMTWLDQLFAGGSEARYVAKAVSNYTSNIATPIRNSLLKEMKELGVDIEMGFFTGAEEESKRLNQQWMDLLMLPYEITKEVMEINSASKKMKTLGGFMSEGVLIGYVDGLKNIVNEVKTPINNIIGSWEKMVSSIIRGNNAIISSLRSIRVDIPDWVPNYGGKRWSLNNLYTSGTSVSLPKLAKGGVITRPTLAMVGEAGSEVVMPLENNTGWISALATQIDSHIDSSKTESYLQRVVSLLENMDLTIELDGDEVANKTIHKINEKSRIQGRSVIK